MALYDIGTELDRDGELSCYAGDDEPVYITKENFIEIARAFGYVLALVPKA